MEYWDEEWKDLSFDGISEIIKYQLSSYGRIRRFEEKLGDWAIKKPYLLNGYYYYTFAASMGDKKRISKCLHKLIAAVFCERPGESAKYVGHLDYSKLNNHINNLQWMNQQQLNAHQAKNPKLIDAKKNKKRTITNSKLTETEVIRLKKKLKRGKNPLYKIAREFGITHTQLNRIRKGENWGHVTID